jgi:5S rRNA maturation endonuclease (ribonuclease M5)
MTWVNGVPAELRTLYRLPELRAGIATGRAAWIVEGERDVETMRRLGRLATTAGAASAWRAELAAHFAGAKAVTVVADRDTTGFEVARRIAADLEAAGVPVRVMVPPAPAKDVTELVEAGGELAELVPLEAERKAGKTTLAMNLTVAALRGGTFLDRPTTVVDGRVAYWDAELGRRRFRQWLRAMDVGDTGARLMYRDFRALPFPAIFDDEVAAEVALALQVDDVGMWIIDPAVHAIARWPTAASSAESDNVTVTQFTNRLDEIKTAAGVDELVVVHHAGKDGTGRGRGASRWEDWPDVIWSLRRGREGSRFQALGRDVELDWIDLSYGRATHHVGVALPGWRSGIDEVVKAITDAGGKVVGAGALEELLMGEDDVRRRKWRDAVEAGEVVTRGAKPIVFTLTGDLENLVS